MLVLGVKVLQSYGYIPQFIDHIVEETQIQHTKKELRDFFDQLSTDNFTKIEEFFDSMPKLSHTVKVKNPNKVRKKDTKNK